MQVKMFYRLRAIRASSEHYKVMLDYMEQNRCLLNPKSGSIVRIKDKLKHWRKLSKLLNRVQHGKSRTTNQWRKSWMDWKYSVKKKAERNGIQNLTSLEARLHRFMEIIREKNNSFVNRSTEYLNPVVTLETMDDKYFIRRGQDVNVSAENNTAEEEEDSAFPGQDTSQDNGITQRRIGRIRLFRKRKDLVAEALQKISEAWIKGAEIQERKASALERMAATKRK